MFEILLHAFSSSHSSKVPALQLILLIACTSIAPQRKGQKRDRCLFELALLANRVELMFDNGSSSKFPALHLFLNDTHSTSDSRGIRRQYSAFGFLCDSRANIAASSDEPQSCTFHMRKP